MSNTVICQNCGGAIGVNEQRCRYCDTPNPGFSAEQSQQYNQPQYNQQQFSQPQFNQQQYAQGQPQVNIYNQPVNQQIVPIKSRVAAGVLAILLGAFGIHKFYLGKVLQGILYLVFCWTYIPAIIGFIEGIIYLCSSDENFARKYGAKVL